MTAEEDGGQEEAGEPGSGQDQVGLELEQAELDNSQELGDKDSKRDKKAKTFYSKVVIRRLPASMKEDEFIQCVEPLPEHDYFRFVKADYSFENDACARAYINFIDQEDVFNFQQKFDGYVFVDNKGNEHIAVVEFASYQKVPGQHNRKDKRKDPKLNTLDDDVDYKKFLESLEAANESSMPTIEQVLEEIEAREREVRSGAKQTTPLLQYMKDRKDEKIKKREDQRESRRKRDEDRKKKYEEERQKRRELKEKEIRDREKRDKTKDEKSDKSATKKESDDADKKYDKSDRKKSSDETTSYEDREQRRKEKREAERAKRKEREEKEKERFRQREEKMRKIRAEKLKAQLEEREREAGLEGGEKPKEREEDISITKTVDATKTALAAEAPEEISATSKPKRYSDKRKEERLKKEREKQEKLKRKAEGGGTITEEKPEAATLNDKDAVNTEAAVSEKAATNEDEEIVVEKKVSKEKRDITVVDLEKDTREEDEELERWKEERRAARLKRDKDREERIQRKKDIEGKKNKERPDMQIYRPGMGKFSSRTIKKESTSSPKSSPEESRETSPSRKSSETRDRRERREKKYKDESKSRDSRESKRPNTRQYVSKTFKAKRNEGDSAKEDDRKIEDKVVKDNSEDRKDNDTTEARGTTQDEKEANDTSKDKEAIDYSRANDVNEGDQVANAITEDNSKEAINNLEDFTKASTKDDKKATSTYDLISAEAFIEVVTTSKDDVKAKTIEEMERYNLEKIVKLEINDD